MTKELTQQEALNKLIEIAKAIDQKDELSPEMSEIITALAKADKNYKDENIVNDSWDNIFDMYDDMKKHAMANGSAIIQSDLPAQLKFRYICTNTGKTWSIRIANIKKCLENEHNKTKQDIFTRAIQTEEGKENILKVINGN